MSEPKAAETATTTPDTQFEPNVAEESAYARVTKAWPVDEAPEGKRIHRAILAASAAMPAIAKNGKMKLGDKDVPFTSMDDVRKALYPIFEQVGINVYIHRVDSTSELQVAEEPWTLAQADPGTGLVGSTGRPLRDGKIPTTRNWVSVIYDLEFVYVGDASSVTITVEGMAYDTNSDKALGKATTAAVKRAFLETFRVVDGKEEEQEASDPEDRNRAVTTDRRAPEGADRGTQQRAAATPGGRAPRGGRKPAPGVIDEVTGRPPAEPSTPAESSEEAVAAMGADPESGEIPTGEPLRAPEGIKTTDAGERLEAAKARVRRAAPLLSYTPDMVNVTTTQVTGITDRTEWLTKPDAVEKLADELERRIADRDAGKDGLKEFGPDESETQP